jgi:hypothetical protein
VTLSPFIMPDYSSGKIYKLYVTGFEELCYVGSTQSSLSLRLSHHKSQAKASGVKCKSAELFEDGNEVLIELVEDFPCETKAELEARERYWIGRFPQSLNHNIPGRTWKERWLAHHEHNLAKAREWKAANADRLREYQAENKEKRNEQAAAVYAAGYGKKRNAKKTEKVECPDCQKVMNRNSLWLHRKTVHPPS